MKEEIGGRGLDDWEMEREGHRFLLIRRQIPRMGVKRVGRVMGDRGQGAPKGRGLLSAGRRPKYARTGQGLGNLLSSARIPVPGSQELRKMEGSRVGGWGKPGRGQGQGPGLRLARG